MKEARETTSDEDAAALEYYLPGSPLPSTRISRVEQFLTGLFRRRGGLRAVVRTGEE